MSFSPEEQQAREIEMLGQRFNSCFTLATHMPVRTSLISIGCVRTINLDYALCRIAVGGTRPVDRIQYVVSLYQGAWFVAFQGKRYGPYDNQAEATETAVRAAHQVPNSQVVVQADDSPSRIEWTCGSDPRRYPD